MSNVMRTFMAGAINTALLVLLTLVVIMPISYVPISYVVAVMPEIGQRVYDFYAWAGTQMSTGGDDAWVTSDATGMLPVYLVGFLGFALGTVIVGVHCSSTEKAQIPDQVVFIALIIGGCVSGVSVMVFQVWYAFVLISTGMAGIYLFWKVMKLLVTSLPSVGNSTSYIDSHNWGKGGCKDCGATRRAIEETQIHCNDSFSTRLDKMDGSAEVYLDMCETGCGNEATRVAEGWTSWGEWKEEKPVGLCDDCHERFVGDARQAQMRAPHQKAKLVPVSHAQREESEGEYHVYERGDADLKAVFS